MFLVLRNTDSRKDDICPLFKELEETALRQQFCGGHCNTVTLVVPFFALHEPFMPLGMFLCADTWYPDRARFQTKGESISWTLPASGRRSCRSVWQIFYQCESNFGEKILLDSSRFNYFDSELGMGDVCLNLNTLDSKYCSHPKPTRRSQHR